MSEQRTAASPSGERKITIADQRAAALEAQKIQEEAGKKRAEKKARIARVLERGYIVDRLTVDIPGDLHGEWVAIDQVERWEALGFWVDKDYAFKRQLHPDGTGDAKAGPSRVGDVIFMTCTQEDHEIMEEVKKELYIKRHGSPAERKRLMQTEEREYKDLVEKSIGDLAVVDEGKELAIGKEGIEEGIEATKQRLEGVSPPPAGLVEMGKRQ